MSPSSYSFFAGRPGLPGRFPFGQEKGALQVLQRALSKGLCECHAAEAAAVVESEGFFRNRIPGKIIVRLRQVGAGITIGSNRFAGRCREFWEQPPDQGIGNLIVDFPAML